MSGAGMGGGDPRRDTRKPGLGQSHLGDPGHEGGRRNRSRDLVPGGGHGAGEWVHVGSRGVPVCADRMLLHRSSRRRLSDRGSYLHHPIARGSQTLQQRMPRHEP